MTNDDPFERDQAGEVSQDRVVLAFSLNKVDARSACRLVLPRVCPPTNTSDSTDQRYEVSCAQ